ncbi:WGR domain-containing protein [Sulfuricurvum sp.]|uniref:WGR domain-containing protein n=1 Tax=Sulfuricurvum sp. TaxID=2025608 RepID=UPI00356174F8
MSRVVNAKERYYKIELIPNLFGEVLLIRTFGSLNRLKPTGVIRQTYNDVQEAMAIMNALIHAKAKRGYE